MWDHLAPGDLLAAHCDLFTAASLTCPHGHPYTRLEQSWQQTPDGWHMQAHHVCTNGHRELVGALDPR